MRDNDAIPIAGGNLGCQQLTFFLAEVLLGGDQQPGVGIELHELAGKLLQQMVGHDVDRLLDEAGLLHFHPRCSHRERLAGHAEIGMTGIMPTPVLCRVEVPLRRPG